MTDFTRFVALVLLIKLCTYSAPQLQFSLKIIYVEANLSVISKIENVCVQKIRYYLERIINQVPCTRNNDPMIFKFCEVSNY